MSDDDKKLFDLYGTLPPHLQKGAKNVQKFAGYFLIIDDKHEPPEYYDWEWFKSSIDDLPGADLTIEQYDTQSMAHQEVKIDTMVDGIVEMLIKIAKAVVTSEYKETLKEKVLRTFTNLNKDSENEDSLSFSKDTKSSNTSFQYRIMFAIANPDVKEDFYSCVSTIRLSANIHDKSSWWGLKRDTRKNFSADLSCMKLACSKDFVSPRKPVRA